MIPSGSRYERAERNFAEAHSYDTYGRVRVTQEDERYYVDVEGRDTLYLMTTLPIPPPPPMEYFVKDGEDFQFLSYKFLRDPTRWWEVADANLQIWYPLDARMGDYIHIPS
jgi:hypothetical protein